MTKAAKQQRTRSQHYVPQFYLRGFANKSGKLFCFDKATDKVFSSSPGGLAQESNFYEIHPGTTEEPVADNAIEQQLQRIEQEFAPRLTKLIRNADRNRITPEELSFFSPLVAIQWMRTRAFRDTAHELIEKFCQAHVDDLVRLNFQGAKATISLPEINLPAIHVSHMLNAETVIQMARGLDRLIWIVGRNQTNQALYTSDHPVVRRANCFAGDQPLLGIRDPGLEFAFPLDNTHILILRDRVFFKEWRRYDGQSLDLTIDQVADFNRLQVQKSSRRVYCSCNDFDLARHICASEPEIRDPHRSRVKIEASPIVDDGAVKKNYIMATALE